MLAYMAYGQNIKRIEVRGFIHALNNDVENVTIYNKSSNKGVVTNNKGEFIIDVALNDRIEIAALQFKTVLVMVDEAVIKTRQFNIQLIEQVNNLDAVLVGKILTGDLLSDIKSIKPDDVPINFYDLGIPGYTGKVATQSERRLHEAGQFKPAMLLGVLGVGLPLNPIINGISGRTKMLKTRVNLEEKEVLIRSIKARLGKDFLAYNPLDNEYVMEFFYFCADDEDFIKRCKNETDFNILVFLKYKYEQYMDNRNIKDE